MINGQSRAEQARSEGKIQEFHVEFDRMQVTVRTNLPEVMQYLQRNYRLMLAEESSNSAGRLSLCIHGQDYVLEGERFNTVRLRTLSPLLPLLQDEVRFHFMRRRPELLWLHAGAVARHGMAILLLAASGAGKSTITAILCERGWQFLSDDVVPIEIYSLKAIPYPQLPSRRVPGVEDWSSEDLRTARREEVTIHPSQVGSEPVTLGQLVFPHFVRDEVASLTLITPARAALEMLRNATNFCDHREAGVARAVVMARSIPGYALTYESAQDAGDLLEASW